MKLLKSVSILIALSPYLASAQSLSAHAFSKDEVKLFAATRYATTYYECGLAKSLALADAQTACAHAGYATCSFVKERTVAELPVCGKEVLVRGLKNSFIRHSATISIPFFNRAKKEASLKTQAETAALADCQSSRGVGCALVGITYLEAVDAKHIRAVAMARP